jgi:CBS domain-containing protein
LLVSILPRRSDYYGSPIREARFGYSSQTSPSQPQIGTGLRVAQFLKPDEAIPLLQPSERLPDILNRLSDASYHALPVVDADGHLLGVVSLEELHVASRSPHLGALVLAADLMRSDVIPLQPDDRLDRALELFVENDLMALPVVDGSPNGRVIGVVQRYDVSAAYLRHVQGTMVS